ncbi:MAG: DUF177 domain-containing protein [Imperialibacter sp.]|uniref:YceD family protein n=1 Tax=Imperialibacter sp. TaxID=2038411 RepID=UPI0032F0174A
MAKSPLKPFEIEIQGLSLDQHSFDFSFDNQLFEAFEGSLIEKGKGSAHVELLKSETMMTLSFEVEGSVELTCDRSLRSFDYELEIRQQLIIKFGDEFAELDDDVVVIPRETQHLNVAQYIYEFISVDVPMKKLHPELVTEEDEDFEVEGSLIYQTSAEQEQDDDTEENVDPRWEALKKFRNN